MKELKLDVVWPMPLPIDVAKELLMESAQPVVQEDRQTTMERFGMTLGVIGCLHEWEKTDLYLCERRALGPYAEDQGRVYSCKKCRLLRLAE